MTSVIHTEIRTETVVLQTEDGGAMPAYVARPEGEATGRGLIVFQEAFGVNPHIRDVTERFAREGYTAIAPALYHRTDPHFESGYDDFSLVAPHMQAVTEQGLSADTQAAYQWLISAEGGQASVVGSIGYCLGGRASFLANAVAPLKAAISYYGGGIAPNPARNQPGLLGRANDLHAPMLLFWGGRDAHIGPDKVRAVEDALIEANKSYTQVVFSYADHGFFCDARASYHPDAAAKAWALTLMFLASHLAE